MGWEIPRKRGLAQPEDTPSRWYWSAAAVNTPS